LPSSRDLAAQLGLSRGTVTQAYEQLAAEGWLTARRGAAPRVAEGAADPVVKPRHAKAPMPETLRYDLRPGRADVHAFPRAAWSRAMRHVLRDAPDEVFGFGDPRGRIELRTALSSYLARVRGVRVDPANLVICSGYTEALRLLAETFAEVGVTTAGMEDPTIADHVRAVTPYLKVVDIPLDDNGLRVDVLRRSGAEVVTCTPAHQFPVGMTMSPERRAAVLDWADETRGWIVEDDYDGEFRFDREPIGALQSRRPSRVVYAGSTSKTLGPAVRLGWIACPPILLDALTEAKRRSRQTSAVDQLALCRLLETGGYDTHLRTVRRAYHRRRDLLLEAVATHLPHASVRGVAAGLHAILELPPAISETSATNQLRKASIGVHGLAQYLRSAAGPPALVIGYATESNHAYPPAVTELLTTLGRL
jgi:GntR family transcriptional regulator/MocR family aminotransferase